MRDIEWLRRKSKAYGLVAEYVNENSLSVYSPKFDFDNWLVIETDNSIELWHKNKRNSEKEARFHLQKTLPKYKKIWALQRINRHNHFVAFHKYGTNMVDVVLTRNTRRFRVS